MIELAEDNLQEIVDGNELVMVQYGATWCGNCKITKPKFKRLAGENENIKFVYVDAEKLPNSRSLAEVKNLPTFAGFKNGKLVNSISGNKPSIITDLLDEVTNN
ncbi:thioredoxin family protein [Marivirga salinae]|jgi:thiol-disulfide isomerase/thioredoxin|uniref:Thioredoxin family protein n=1 Tax=Marivirga salinarum TaxID=3059078 RepID=A0AA49GDY8_9BACT|nr:thioredoxin family protein [Marivirga sp. BDSF4-3]WKK76405.2 thioredoxin family protein [Marivirga sp. BDSF4-3]